MSFELERSSGKKSYIIWLRATNIVWSENLRFSKWNPFSNLSFVFLTSSFSSHKHAEVEMMKPLRESRELLRKLYIGKVECTVPSSGREFGSVFLDQQNVVQDPNQQKKEADPFLVDLLRLEEQAKEKELGLWAKLMFPRVLGYEGVGVIESVREDVEDLKEGDIVMPTLLSECRECISCKSEKTNLCMKYNIPIHGLMPDMTSRMSVKGQKLYHLFTCSTFAEFTVVNSNYVVKVDPKLTPTHASLLSCGFTTGFGDKVLNVTCFGHDNMLTKDEEVMIVSGGGYIYFHCVCRYKYLFYRFCIIRV